MTPTVLPLPELDERPVFFEPEPAEFAADEVRLGRFPTEAEYEDEDELFPVADKRARDLAVAGKN